MRRWLLGLIGQERARDNARSACQEASRRHVERDEVELFLAQRRARAPRSA